MSKIITTESITSIKITMLFFFGMCCMLATLSMCFVLPAAKFAVLFFTGVSVGILASYFIVNILITNTK